MIIGLTGASGSGKSTVAKLFSSSGFCVIDCDEISRTLDTDPEYISKIKDAFGASVISFFDGKKRVDRKALAKAVFGDNALPNAVKTIDSISHPMIIEKIKSTVRAGEKSARAFVIDAPLLFDSGLDKMCNVTVGVVAPEKARIARLCLRDGIDEKTAERRFKNQKSDDFIKSNCDFVINNDKTEEELFSLTREVIEKISKRI